MTFVCFANVALLWWCYGMHSVLDVDEGRKEGREEPDRRVSKSTPWLFSTLGPTNYRF